METLDDNQLKGLRSIECSSCSIEIILLVVRDLVDYSGHACCPFCRQSVYISDSDCEVAG